MLRRYCAWWFVFGCLVMLAGCGSPLASVSGTVTLDGQPLEQGRVVFQAPGLPTGVGEIRRGGRYQLQTGTQTGIATGHYVVTVSAYQVELNADGQSEPAFRLTTPAKYNSPETSGLSANIQPGGNQIDFGMFSSERPP
jgi:hypothetical protein